MFSAYSQISLLVYVEKAWISKVAFRLKGKIQNAVNSPVSSKCPLSIQILFISFVYWTTVSNRVVGTMDGSEVI